MKTFPAKTLLCFFIICSIPLEGQIAVPDITQEQVSDNILNINQIYDSILPVDRSLINGEIYFPHQRGADNHPFYQSTEWQTGSIHINGIVYYDRLLRYDLALDRLLYLHIHEGAQVLVLNLEDVTYFTIAEDAFRRVDDPSMLDPVKASAGYYRVVYEGRNTLLARYRKLRISQSGIRRDTFNESVRLFLITGEKMVKIASNRQLIRALEAPSKEVREYMNHRQINILNAAPGEIGQVIKFAESLTETPQ